MGNIRLGPLITLRGASLFAHACLRVHTLKSLPHSRSAASEHEEPQQRAPSPSPALSAKSETSPATLLPDVRSEASRSPLHIAMTIRDHAQILALDAPLPTDVRAALAEDLLASLARALARVAVERQTWPSPCHSEDDL